MKEKQRKTTNTLRTKIKLCTILYRHLYNIEFMKKNFKGKTIVESQKPSCHPIQKQCKAILGQWGQSTSFFKKKYNQGDTSIKVN